MYQPIVISPSLLGADLAYVADAVRVAEEAGAGMIHVDVMDGHFVPNITMGVPLVKSLSALTSLPLDVHLMVSNPLVQLPWFIEAGATHITVHQETLSDEELSQALDLMEEASVRPAISLCPETNPSVLAGVLPRLAMVLIMSVRPGFSGQSYIEGSELKVATVAAMARELGCDDLLIEVDGGIDTTTIGRCAAQGADVFVCGKAVFGASDPAQALNEILEAGARAVRERDHELV